ncbi:ABC transporter ATP-binding protein [Lactococcus cremoris]|uniref:Multidrug ABC transporter ATP-binding protein n=1 Tax=Lactococcus cremoris subsp. cremoris IBB477 TaxID=1449093 RepID=A0A1E7G1T4_LACLC|nr:ABC transporter ATP-binding protein [Lactococcus cremoris]KZK09761.1 ABC transporter ATP-binding protein EcsA [Lactococcus cremoris]MCT0456235.1 ABC transporter ATP-binding protein [Lactococcus cremoris]MCT0474769.1 ABC transporter ATP-binding protein [Lactococcus cremoris]MCT0476689.1 ABC transporter ATP-binding protein [Lactococcus cremoris]MCT0510159.1 ABC transporter ATP-binding protein [Lactococcus cremoris]
MLKVTNLTGGYLGHPVLKELNFEIKGGELVGLIGLNGAGKSTTIQEIIGLLTPYSGQIELDGLTLQQDLEGYRRKIGFIPETPSLYEELTLREHIEVTALAYGISVDLAFKRAEKLLETFRLSDKLDWFPVNFSKGMKQKVMIICAFLVEPSLYIVDEPFMGLDPLAIQDLIDLMMEMKKTGSSILMSTHILATAEKFCDKFIVLHEGQVVAFGTVEELRSQFNQPKASLDEIYLALTKGNIPNSKEVVEAGKTHE